MKNKKIKINKYTEYDEISPSKHRNSNCNTYIYTSFIRECNKMLKKRDTGENHKLKVQNEKTVQQQQQKYINFLVIFLWNFIINFVYKISCNTTPFYIWIEQKIKSNTWMAVMKYLVVLEMAISQRSEVNKLSNIYNAIWTFGLCILYFYFNFNFNFVFDYHVMHFNNTKTKKTKKDILVLLLLFLYIESKHLKCFN